MSLVTWEAIGAVILMAIPATISIVFLVGAYCAKNEENRSNFALTGVFIGILPIVQLPLFWELIGVGLFGVTR